MTAGGDQPALPRKPSLLQRRIARAVTLTSQITEQVTNQITDEVTFLTEGATRMGEALAAAPAAPSLDAAPQETTLQREERHKMAEQLGAKLMHPDRIMFRDKVVFFLGVLNVVLIAFWIGRSPSTYYHFWVLKCCTLFPLRWWSYKKRGWHYLMLELCYFSNFLGIAHVYFFPSVAARKLTFAYGAGPLQFSILAMRNSLVFHDFDKTTTLMMHASPAITAWTLRWYPSAAWLAGLSPVEATAFAHATWTEMVLWPIVFYLVWVVMYYLITFVVLHDRIVARGRATMFSLMVPKDPEAIKRSALARIVVGAPERLQPLVYLGCHALAASVTFLPIKFFWDSYWFHTAALMYCLGVSVWNGGNYYFRVFARKYLAQLQEEAAAKTKAS